MNHYPHHIGDYGKDTRNLSVTEHGAYRLLLDYNYATERPIPTDSKELYRIVGAQTPAERKAVDKVAERFFPVNGDGRRHNKRAEVEIESYQERAARNREVGKLGGRPKKPADNPDGLVVGYQEVTQKEPADNPSRKPVAIESKAKGANAPLSEPAVPDCPHEAILTLFAKHLPMLTQPRLWEGHRAELLRARWKSCSKQNAVWPGYSTVDAGLAFWDQFFADIAKAKKLTEGIARGDGSYWKPDLPWLLKADNFAKVIEGKYHS